MKKQLINKGRYNPFRKGDIVVCVDVNFAGRYPGKRYPVMDHIYTVRGLFDDCVWLTEIRNPIDPVYEIEPMWFHWHFIKLEELASEQIEEITEKLEEVS